MLIKNLPAGVKYTLTETELTDGWTQTGVTGDSGTIAPTETAEAAFTNTYEVKGYVTLKAEKMMEGEVPEGFTYTFQLFAADEAGNATGGVLQTKTNNPLDTAETIPQGDAEVANPDYNKSMVLFDRITYTEEGTYYYVIIEDADVEDQTVITDGGRYKVTVVVTDADGKGELTAEAAYEKLEDNTDSAGFLNKRKDGSLKISKEIAVDTKAETPAEFTVQLTLTDKGGELLTGDYPAVRTAKDGAETEETVSVSNGSATITLKGGETLTINGLPHGATYETAEESLAGWTQTGAAGETGTITGDQTSEVSYENTYDAAGTLPLNVRKVMDPPDLPMTEGCFSFILMKGNSELERVDNNSRGEASFTPIEFGLEDVGETYSFTIQEQSSPNFPTSIQYAFDNTKYTVTVEVADNGNGTLSVTPAYTKNGESVDEIVFTNSTRVDVPVRKVWEGDAAVVGEMRPTRVLVQRLADGEVVATRAISTGNATAADSSVWESRFTGLPEYKDGKKIVYTAQETVPSNYSVTIGKDGDTLVLVNTYYEATVTLGGRKTVKGMKLTDGAYSFKLEPPYGGAPMPESDEVTCDAEGNFSFGEMTFRLSDLEQEDGSLSDTAELVYTIREVIPAGAKLNEEGTAYVLDGMAYDAQACEVTVTLAFDGESKRFTATKDKEASDVEFINRKTETSLKVVKQWEGNAAGGMVDLELYTVKNGQYTPVDPQPDFVYAQEDESYLYEHLPLLDANDEELVYAVKEKHVEGYLTIYSNEGAYAGKSDAAYDGATIINRAVTDIRVQKVWSGSKERPKITLTLYCNGKPYSKKPTGPDAEGWYHWTNLPVQVNGQAAVYSVKEEALRGWTASYSNTGTYSAVTDAAYDGGVIRNSTVPRTGDRTNLGLLIGLVLLSGAGLAAALVLGRKRRS